MKIISCILFSMLFLCGCATMSPQTPTTKNEQSVQETYTSVSEKIGKKDSVVNQESELSLELKSLDGNELDGYVHTKGVVFAKILVEGILKADFLKLMIEDIEDASHRFQLFIGNKMGSKSFPWEGADRNVGHFFIELPMGEYLISSVAIPVGSTMATEPSNVSFKVAPGQIAYLGTLKLVGTKEKVRLGGVPVIKPGFEYVKEVISEKDEARSVFYGRYPNFKAEIVENLMVVEE